MDIIDGWFGHVLYTDKEQSLHVSGSFGQCHPSPPQTVATSLLVQNGTSFYHDGFFCAENAVSSGLIREARKYINGQYKVWLKTSKRQDDWRCHLMVDLSDPERAVEHPALMNLLIHSPSLLGWIEALTGARLHSIFYSQVAFRTPLSAKQIAHQLAHAAPDYSPGAEYHLDGTANSAGTRFPDPWSLLVGIALVDINTEDQGNFTVFPGWHVRRDWSAYPEEKRTKSLPDLGTPTHVCLKAGDAVIAHVLLPHRGGKNSTGALSPATHLSNESSGTDIDDSIHSTAASSLAQAQAASVKASAGMRANAHANKPSQHAQHAVAAPHPYGGSERWEIPAHTREMMFFRVRVAAVDYESAQRGPALLADPWAEFPGVMRAVSLASARASADAEGLV